MKALHGITIAGVEAWVWVNIYGGNGAALGRVRGRTTHHLQLRQRGTPPPITTDPFQRDTRAYWNPWGGNAYWVRQDGLRTAEEILTPLCGRIKSASRQPYTQNTYDRGYGGQNPNECPDCLRVAQERGITPHYYHELVQNDPWNTQVDRYARGTTLDPVSGM